MEVCPKCNNTLVRTLHTETAYVGMGKCRSKTTYLNQCPYCIWKGIAGPGALLKYNIKKINKTRINGQRTEDG